MKPALLLIVFALILVAIFAPIAQVMLVKRQRENRIRMIRPLNRYDVRCKRDMP